MKLTKKELVRLIEQEIKIIEAEEGEEVMAAIEEVPDAAENMAEKIKAEIEQRAEPSGMDPLVLAQALAALLTTD